MRKFYYYLVSMLVAIAVAVGCTEDTTNDNGVNLGEVSDKEFMEVTALLESERDADDKSRTTLDDDNSGKVVWSEGDSIGAWMLSVKHWMSFIPRSPLSRR